MTCRNWESGVVIPVPVEKTADIRNLEAEKNQSKIQAAPKKLLATGDPGRKIDVERTIRPGCDADGTGADATVDAGARTELHDAGHYPVMHHERETMQPTAARSLGEVFTAGLPVPIHYPAQKHVAQGKQPWFFRD